MGVAIFDASTSKLEKKGLTRDPKNAGGPKIT
jgi:hypothetical protein